MRLHKYSSAFLGLMGIPIPDFREASIHPTVRNITATDIIHWSGAICPLSRGETKEIRCEVLGRVVQEHDRWTAGKFQRQVLEALWLGLTVDESDHQNPVWLK
jgi:hypothetical protein